MIGGIGAAAATPTILFRLVGLVADRDQGVRESAVSAIISLGGAAATPDFLEQLADLLVNGDESVRQLAERIAWNLGVAAATPHFLERLAGLLDDGDVYTRWAAVKAVESLGGAAATPGILVRLGGLLGDSDAAIRYATAAAVRSLGGAAATPAILGLLANQLTDRDEWVHQSAERAFEALGQSASARLVLDSLSIRITNDDDVVRQTAVQAICRITAGTFRHYGERASAPVILGCFIGLFEESDERFRRSAADALMALSKESSIEPTAEVISILLASDHEPDRWGALISLRKVITTLAKGDWHWSDAATPELLERLPRLLDDPAVRWTAWNAVRDMDDPEVTDSILERLGRLFDDPDSRVAWSAARIATSLGARAATPEIFDGLADMLAAPDEATREHAKYPFMAGIGGTGIPKSFLDRLARLLGDQDKGVRWDSVVPAARLASDKAGPEYLAWLARLLVHPDSKVRDSAASVVRFAGGAVAKAEILGPLGRLLEDPDDTVRRSATRAVEGLGAASSVFLNQLADRLMDRDAQVRAAAAWSVHHLGDMAATPAILRNLSFGLTDRDSEVQTAALYAVEELGGGAATPAILASLALILADTNEEVRRKAVKVVKKMGAGAATIQFANKVIEAYQDPNRRSFESVDILIFLMLNGLRCHRVITEGMRKRSLLPWKRTTDTNRTRLVWASINEPSPGENLSHAGS